MTGAPSVIDSVRMPSSASKQNIQADIAVPGWADLLKSCYDRAGLAFPIVKRLHGERMPEPYRTLLVHSEDMTPTLEDYHGGALGLKVLARNINASGDRYEREVLLTLPCRDVPVEYGAIRIYLDHFPEYARALVLEERRPLGAILQSEGIPHVGWPQAFFSLEADDYIRGLFGLKASCAVYGRRNVLLDIDRRMLAEVIEILPPLGNRASESKVHI